MKKNIRKLVYTLCFAGIMLIDWTRGSQNWNVWASAVNLTGVVMTVVMLTHFTWKNRSLKCHLIWLALWLVGSAVGYLVWQQNPGVIFRAQYLFACLSIGGLGIVLLCIWQDKKQIGKHQASELALLGLLGVLSVLMLFSKQNELWPLWYFVMFGAFYFIPFTKEEQRDIWEGLANGVITGFFILQIFAYGFRPYDEVRYMGAYGNCNMNALMYTITYAMLLYKLHGMFWDRPDSDNKRDKRKRWLLTAFYFVLAAGLLDFVLFTITRTAMLTVGLVTLLFIFFEAFFYRRIKIKKLLVLCSSFLVCIILLFPCVYLTIRYLPAILHHPVWWGGEYHPNKVHSFDPYDSTRYVSLEEFFEEALGRFHYIILPAPDAALTGDPDSSALLAMAAAGEKGAYQKRNPIGAAVASITQSIDHSDTSDLLDEKEAKSSFKVRTKIYKKYYQNLNWTGHLTEEGYFPITVDYHAWHAQNVFLQIAFYHGIPAGICLIILMAALGVGMFRQALTLRQKYSILGVLVWLVFVSYGMLECVWYLGQSILFLMYFVPRIAIDAKSVQVE